MIDTMINTRNNEKIEKKYPRRQNLLVHGEWFWITTFLTKGMTENRPHLDHKKVPNKFMKQIKKKFFFFCKISPFDCEKEGGPIIAQCEHKSQKRD